MKQRLLTLIFLFAISSFAGNVLAQDFDNPLAPTEKGTKVLLGPCAGINNVTHAADKLATFAGDKYCPYFDGGTGNGFYFGLTYEYPFGKPAETISSIIARVIYSSYNGSMSIAGDEYPSLVESVDNPNNYEVIRSATRHDLDVKYSVAAIEIMYKQNFMKEYPLGITAGPTIEIPLTNDVYQTYKIVKPDNAQFRVNEKYNYKDNYRTVVLKDGPIDNAVGVRIGLKFGLQYEIILGEGLYVVPALYYNYSITKVKSDEDWRINLFQFGADLRYAF